MGDLLLKRAAMVGAKIDRLVVGIDRLPDRTVDRATAIRWLRDGHSLVPIVDGRRLPALQLVEVPPDTFVIRTDNEAVDEDRLPPLPAL